MSEKSIFSIAYKALKNILRGMIPGKKPVETLAKSGMEAKLTFCKCGCGFEVTRELIVKLAKAESISGLTFRINSGARCLEYNRHIGSTDTSSHIKGLAVDLHAPDGPRRYRIVKSLLEAGFRRIGVARAFIHADIDTDKVDTVYPY